MLKIRKMALAGVLLAMMSALSSCAANIKDVQPKDNLCLLPDKLSGRQDLRVQILGDSHMAADFFSERLAELMVHPDMLGFAYPLRPRYHRRHGINYENRGFSLHNSLTTPGDYVIGGISAVADKAGSAIELTSEDFKRSFTFGVYFKAPGADAALHVASGNGRSGIINAKNPGHWEYREVDSLFFPLKLTARQEGLVLGGYNVYQRTKPNRLIDTMGINGAPAGLWRSWNLPQVAKQHALLRYDLVLIAYGANDAVSSKFNPRDYKDDLRELYNLIHSSNPRAAVVLLAPPSVTRTGGGYYPNAAVMQRAQKELAAELGLFQVDFDTFMRQTGGKAEWIKNGWSQNDLHLTAPGYSKLADYFYEQLKKRLSSVCAVKAGR